MTPISKTLRIGARGEEFVPARSAHSKAKPERSYIDPFCHNETRVYARSGEKWLLTTICSGVRYILEPIEPAEKYPYIRKIRSKVA